MRGRHGSGSRLVATFLLPALQARIAGRVGVIADAFVKSFLGKRVVVQNRYPIREDGIEPMDTLIMITLKESANELLGEIKEGVGELYAVGDCVSPRRVCQA